MTNSKCLFTRKVIGVRKSCSEVIFLKSLKVSRTIKSKQILKSALPYVLLNISLSVLND